jgi:DNA-directed RNA polymerase subunit M/transcription elongation factor TFIIS|tara:strand:+ start:263 stop:586 length:324 start_codon:yes stop_codon:yes gene_type:complete
MFCPECGTLAFPTPSGDINCANYECTYSGPQNKRFVNISSSTKAEIRTYEVIKDSEEMKGVLSVGDCMCAKCNSEEVYSYLEPLLDMAEIQVAMLTCKECGFGWREH